MPNWPFPWGYLEEEERRRRRLLLHRVVLVGHQLQRRRRMTMKAGCVSLRPPECRLYPCAAITLPVRVKSPSECRSPPSPPRLVAFWSFNVRKGVRKKQNLKPRNSWVSVGVNLSLNSLFSRVISRGGPSACRVHMFYRFLSLVKL